MMNKRFVASLVFMLMGFACLRAQYTIYPVPQRMTAGSDKVNLRPDIRLVADATIDEATLGRAVSILQEKGFRVVETGESTLRLATIHPDQSATEGFANASILQSGKFDRHALRLDESGITIVGENTNAVFFGLASLEQILEQPAADGTFPSVTIFDYADQRSRGLIEGYYGYPYSVSVKKDLMRFMMRYKMNTYMYGAKSDSYHSQRWKEAYPVSITKEQEKNGLLSQDMIRELTRTSAETKVSFIWAIHPGNAFVDDPLANTYIMNKFKLMYNLGVRQFGVFVDDVRVPSEISEMKKTADVLTALQGLVDKQWNVSDAAPEDTVRPIHFVPQIYCNSFAHSETQRKNFMSAIGKTPAKITIYTTGQAVWTVPNNAHTSNMNQELGRDMAWWWNYSCNDNARGQIYPMDMYSNFHDMRQVDGNARMPQQLSHCLGLISNPMQQGEIAKTSLFSVADFAWNNDGFDNLKSWEASFQALIADPTLRKAYRAIVPYLRWNEPESVRTLINNYKSTRSEANFQALTGVLSQIIENCNIVDGLRESAVESDRLLHADLRPWINLLRADCRVVIAFMELAQNTTMNAEEKKAAYRRCHAQLEDLGSNTDYTVYSLSGMGDGISRHVTQAWLCRLYLEPFMYDLDRELCYSLLVDAPQKAVDRTNWKLTAYSYATTDIELQNGGQLKHLMDGNSSTWYHSNWKDNSGKGMPQAFLVDMVNEHLISGFSYQARTDRGTTKPLSWRVYTYQDASEMQAFGGFAGLRGLTQRATKLSSESLGTPTLAGRWSWTGNAQSHVEFFDSPVYARYILFVADESTVDGNGDHWITCAEFNALEGIRTDKAYIMSHQQGGQTYYMKMIPNTNNAMLTTVKGDATPVLLANEPDASYGLLWSLKSEQSGQYIYPNRWETRVTSNAAKAWVLDTSDEGLITLWQRIASNVYGYMAVDNFQLQNNQVATWCDKNSTVGGRRGGTSGNSGTTLQFRLTPTVPSFIVKYMVDGKVYKRVSYDEGAAVVAEPDPSLEGFAFSGWQGLPTTMPDHDVVVHGSFSSLTSITTLKTQRSEDAVYNLQGQRLDRVGQKGVYIVDGHKVIR